MHKHEKMAFLKFFITYFISVAILILASGYFYFSQMQTHLMRMEEYSLIEYARHLKMGETLEHFSDDFYYKFENDFKHIDIKNFRVSKKEFSKLIPVKMQDGYIRVVKSRYEYDKKLQKLRFKIIFMQIFLLSIFAYISYMLARSALKPLQQSILTLDKFAKDLIHDLNTPVTSIKLNLKILEKNIDFRDNSALKRVKKSVYSIPELHENLTILLQEETFQFDDIDICKVINEVVDIQKQIYSDIEFIVECNSLKVKLNREAIKQILQNIISNASKYNIKNGYVKVYTKEKVLYIEDSGKGIKEPAKIFQRSYSDEKSSGIGLDIVNRLAIAMNIDIKVKTKSQGSIFILYL